MAIGKNKRLGKKKGSKKKLQDPFTKKDWYNVKVPAIFSNRLVGKTPVNRTQGLHVASEALKGRVFEISLGDLKKDSEEQSFRKMKLIAEEVQGDNVLCNFYGMSFTTDKLASLFRKWQTTIEAYVDARTTDGYLVRMFCIGFTTRRPNQIRKTSYAQTSQVRAIRKRMVTIMKQEIEKNDLKTVMEQIIAEAIGKEIGKQCEPVYPLRDTFVRKVKIIRRPKVDLHRLMELHTNAGKDQGDKVDRVEPGKVEALEGSGGRL